MMWTKAFWKATAERAIKTGVQAVGAVWPISAAMLGDTDWALIGYSGLLAAGYSVLMSIGGDAATGTGPSFVAEEKIDNSI